MLNKFLSSEFLSSECINSNNCVFRFVVSHVWQLMEHGKQYHAYELSNIATVKIGHPPWQFLNINPKNYNCLDTGFQNIHVSTCTTVLP